MFARSLKKLRAALFLFIASAVILGAVPAQAAAPVVRTTYIVTVKPGTNAEVKNYISLLGETTHSELTEVLDGFILDMTDTEVASLKSDANVLRIEADAPMSLLDTQNPTPSWGLDRIDQTNTTYDKSYTYPSSAGSGVNIYIVDTGVMASNPDFAGRIQTGYDTLGQNLQGADCNGHGTHVAGTAAGTTYGVAKKATIIPVRVLSCAGSGSWSYFIAGLDWIVKNNPAGTPAVMSASIGGNRIQSVNDAIENLYLAGITPVVAAGNSNDDACKYSPASAPDAITVGATESTDARAYYSNFGDCVDVFAPGSNIVSDNYLDPTTPRSLSGTSMATPHVSGLAALYLSGNPASTPAQVQAAIQAGAQSGVVTNALTTNNLLINDGFIKSSLPPVGAPTGVTVSAITATGATVTWQAPVGTAAAKSYNVEYKAATDATWTMVNSLLTTITLTGLTANTNYSVRVSSVDGATISAPSAESMFVTGGLAPAAPSNLRTSSVFGDQATITWDVPNGNGGKITGYNLYTVNGSTRTLVRAIGTNSYTFTGLTPLTSYSVAVEAINTFGTSPVSSVFTYTTTAVTPAKVGTITFSNITANSATASWAPVAQINPSVPITYTVNTYLYTIIGFVARTTYTTSVPTVNLTGLTRAATQLVYVTANSGTIAGPISLGYTFNTPATVPSIITSFTATRNGANTTLAWLPPADSGGSPVTGFQLDKQVGTSWTPVATLAVGVQSYVVPTPARGSSDTYRVSASNAYGLGAAKVLVVTNQITAPLAPQNVTGVQSSDLQSITVSWDAPADDGGSPITGYRVVYGTSPSVTNSVVVAVPATQTTVTFNIAVRGSISYYFVQAINALGFSPMSAPVSATRPAVVPAAPTAITSSWNSDGTLQVRWSASTDNGGSAITAYALQRLENGTWVTKYTGLATTIAQPREVPGSVWQYRVLAVNAIGSSAASPTLNVQVPATYASAPQNFTAVDNGSAVVVSYSAPAYTGGGTISNYAILYSRDGGATWTITYTTTQLTALVVRPTKGQTWLYRVVAINQAGAGASTPAISISVATTLPAAVSTTATFASNGSINLAWYLAGNDNGGLTLLGYRVEKSYDNSNWSQLTVVPGTQTTLNVPRENPGVRVYFRVSAVNALGAGVANSTSIMMPYLKATAPQNVTITDNGSSVVATFQPSADLGGSGSVVYYLQTSRDGGATWNNSGMSVNGVATGSRPAKGTTQLYRMIAYTAYGYSDASPVVTISVATTVAGVPGFTAFVLNSDKTMTVSWRQSTDNGGTAITANRLYTSLDGTNWSTGTDYAPSVTSATLPAAAPGARVYVRLASLNAVGLSAFSSTPSLQTPYVAASAVNNLTASVASGLINLTWAAPSFVGGTSFYYQVATSVDGVNYTNRASTYGTAAAISAPAKGQSVFVRVWAVNPAGAGATAQVTAATPTTVTTSVSGFSLNRANATTVNVLFNAPADLGGVSTWNYKVQVLQNGTFNTVATGVGAATNAVAINLAQVTSTTPAYAIRIVANNSNGDSAASYVLSIR